MKYAANLAVLALTTAIAGCSTADPVVYQGLASAAQLRPDPSDVTGRAPYSYKTAADWKQYSKVLMELVVYAGSDNQFDKMPDADRKELANYMHDSFLQKLKQRFALAKQVGPGTLRVRITLAGAKATNALMGPASHLDIAGGVYNTIQAARDKQGSMTGSVSYAVEVYDASAGRLLLSYVAKQYPSALNVGASFGALQASRIAIDKGADDLLTRLR
ncbi:DUF3313 domain-containing protein [Rhizobium sp. NPDC090279]|uniref:DUF3313 domain-containing protein n=1 Tax=Rhizobium sp. NPDC090279 TaxID=3364499 RepID=UPI00383B632E